MPRLRATPLRRWALLLVGCAVLVAPARAQPADALALGGADAATEAVFVRALTAQWLGDHEAAVTLLGRVLERHPDEPAALAALAASEAALGNRADALALASRVRSLAPENPELLRETADLQRELGRGDDAAFTLEVLLRADPDDREALSTLAEIHEFAGRQADALRTLERLLAVGGEDETVRLRMHAQLVRAGDADAARVVLAAGAAALPGARTLRLRLARSYADAGRADSAVAVLDELIARNSSDGEAAALRDELAGTPHPAAEPADPSTRLRRAAHLLRGIDENPGGVQRIRDLVGSLAEGPDAAPEALLVLGLAEHHAGAFPRAAALLDAALRADPRSIDGWGAVIDAHARAGDAPAAARAADEARVLFPGQPALLEIAAGAYAAADREADARAAIDEALALDESDGLTASIRDRLVRARQTLD